MNNVVNPEGVQPPPVPEAPKTTPWTIGKKTYNIQQIDDDVRFIPFEDGKDDTKAILAEVDTDNYDVEPVVVDVPIPNVPAFAKVKTQKVVKGVSIIAKKQPQQESVQPQTTNQPSAQTAQTEQQSTTAAQNEQVQQEVPTQPNVQPTVNANNEQSIEDKKADIERRRQEELKPYDERDSRSLEAITPNNPNHPTFYVGKRYNEGDKIIVESVEDSTIILSP